MKKKKKKNEKLLTEKQERFFFSLRIFEVYYFVLTFPFWNKKSYWLPKKM